jgi:hypothetical protein
MSTVAQAAAQAALRCWDEANTILFACLTEVVSRRVPARDEAEKDDRHVRLNRLSRRLGRHLTALYDQLGVDGEPPPMALCYGVVGDEPLFWPMSNPWMSPWADSAASEWRIVRENLARGAEPTAILRHQQARAEEGRCWLEAVLAGTAYARPPLPTAEYCLMRDGRVRWEGEPIELRKQLRRLLEYLLSRDGYPIPARDVQFAIWEDNPPTPRHFANTLGFLNAEPELIAFPWRWSADGDAVRRC